MGVMVISLGACRSAGENVGYTCEGCPTNANITNKICEMPVFLWIFIWRTSSVIWDSSNVCKQSTPLNSDYDA
jgi:hypothetical protein